MERVELCLSPFYNVNSSLTFLDITDSDITFYGCISYKEHIQTTQFSEMRIIVLNFSWICTMLHLLELEKNTNNVEE